MEKIDVRKVAGGWAVTTRKNKIKLASCYRKSDAILYGADFCRASGTAAHPLSLVIFKVNGTIQEERTYPRSKDPRRSRG
jgi:hypothetical protein